MSTHNKINIAVIGATGYTGLDLVLLLSKHPRISNESNDESGKLNPESSPFNPDILMVTAFLQAKRELAGQKVSLQKLKVEM